MTEQLQHDPRTKQQIKDALYAFLYTPIEKQFEKRLSELIVKNTLLCGYSHKSFVYKSNLYNIDTAALPRKMNRLQENFKAGDVVLTPEEVQKIDDKLSTMQFDVFGGHSTK